MPDKEEFVRKISQEYHGSDIDISYLEAFHEIVKAEESGMYIFEEPILIEEKIKNDEIEKPTQKKSKLGLSPFKLKK